IAAEGLSGATELSRRDAKTALQELVQANGAPAPAYRVVAVEGPDHDRRFVMSVEVGGQQVAEGKGRTKKLAEQAAATAALALAKTGGLDAVPLEEAGTKK